MENVREAVKITNNLLSGEVWECGAFRGDNILIIKRLIDESNDNRIIRIFDTFTGQPFSGPYDSHPQGSMNGTNFDLVKSKFEGKTNSYIYPGIMPFTFSGLENVKLSVVNIDVDNYDSVKDCLEFVYPRTESGGYIFLDDYQCPMCLGCKKATDEFLQDKPEKLVVCNGAHIIKLG